MSSDALKHGVPVKLAEAVHRVVAPNPGVMTGAGTNSYLVGKQALDLIDPGPAIEAHAEALLAAAKQLGGQIQRVFTTHTHSDHSPALQLIKQHNPDVQVIGLAIDDDGFQDASFKADHQPEDNERFDTDDGSALRAVHTPGHVANHVCWLHEASGIVFTGDHIMQGSTVVIIPPAGDMADYIDSLNKMRELPMLGLAPGHGELIETPLQEVEAIIAHRLGRESKVIERMQGREPADLETITPWVYDDVDPGLHPIAQLSLWAHLLKLRKEGRALEQDGLWRLRSNGTQG